MTPNRSRRLVCAAVVAGLSIALTACGSSASGGTPAAKATSAASFGGMNALVAAAKKEGTLNAIALPADWADYGAIIKAFETKYGIKVNDQAPEDSSQDEINAITATEGQDRAPDVVDLGTSFATSAASQGLLAPYEVAGWSGIPAAEKDPSGLRYADYGGYISIGCDASRVKVCPTSFADLLKPAYKGEVALNGSPVKAGAAFAAVYAASLANGGSLGDIKPGLAFFAKLKKAGNFNPVAATSATDQKGETPVSIDWDYLNAGYAQQFKSQGVDWTVNVPTDGQYANYYYQAISKWAPHPAAARLWEEFLYSAQGQNLFLQGFSRPAEMTAMQSAGTLDRAAAAKLPRVTAAPTFPTTDQANAAQAAVVAGWSAAVGG